jgi:cytochrome c-type biogenesis protein CcmH
VSRWTSIVGIGLLAALVAVILLRPATPMTAAERADALAAGLRCPDCQGLSVADSPTGSAQEIRRQIDELVAAGATDSEVREHFVARYGDWVLLSPRSPAVWILPFVVVLAGAAGLGAWLLLRARAPAARAAALPDAERRRIHEEAEALDG